MPLLDDKQKTELAHHFQHLEGDVNVLLFTKQKDCDFCQVTTDLMTELVALSPKIKFRALDMEADKVEAGQYRIDKTPAIVVKGTEDYGIRFYGVPAGHEFSTLVEDIIMVSKGTPGLAAEVLRELEKVDQPLRIQVLISPTCPYCPTMVRAAHRFAMASKFITAEMVEVSEFPELARLYEVQGVPHTMLGESYGIVGVYKDLDFAREVLRGIGKLPMELTEHAKIHGDEIAEPDLGPHVHGGEHEHEHHEEHQHPQTEIAEPKSNPKAKASASSGSSGRPVGKKSLTEKTVAKKSGAKESVAKKSPARKTARKGGK